MYIVIAIFGFGLLVLVHEFGHFIVARLNGVKVEEFAIGMGPSLFSHKGKATTYSIKALPIGGMCQMKGESTGEVDRSDDSFQSKKPLQRMSIIFAGPLMNIITGFLFFTILGFIQGYATNVVREVSPDSPAVTIGLMPGDSILSVNRKNTPTFNDIVFGMSQSEGKPLLLGVKRGETVTEYTVTPKAAEGGGYIIGFYPVIEEQPSLPQAFTQGLKEARSMIQMTIASLSMLFTGKVGLNQMSGPVAIIGIASEAARLNLPGFFNFLGFLSINLAVFNLLPFPALDGGWLIVLVFELLTRKKPSEKFMAAWNGAGFVLLMTLMLLITFKDIFFPLQY